MNIIFDFDGVILNSHKVKTKAFFEIFKSYGDKIAYSSKKFHEKNIGKSRYHKFKFIFRKILKRKLKKKEIKKLDQKFDNFIKKKIQKLQPSKYLLDFLKKKKYVYNFYISTSTPQKKIKEILEKKKIN